VSRRTPPIVAVLLAVSLLLTGCGGKSSTATGTSGGGSSQSQASTAPQSQASTAPQGQASTGTAAAGTQCPSSNTKNFAKSRFVLHTGEAFGAFHRYLYKPYQAGSFRKGTPGRLKAFLKAGAAALFIKRQVRLATEDVKANPTLCKAVAAPLGKVGDTISGAVSKLKGGDASGITDANTSIDGIKSSSASNGVAVKEDPNPNLNG